MIRTESKTLSRPLYLSVTEMLLIPLGFGALIALLYGNLSTAWWGWDDPQILKHAYQYSPWEYFFSPEAWRGFQPANLNPWIILSFDMDLSLFELNPSAFYLHHLFALWLVSGVTYAFLRLWLNPFWSFTGSALFICSAPVTNIAYELMNRHYLEGLLFFIISLYLYVQALREKKPVLAWLGALSYFFAVSAKEVFVPLALLLPAIPEKDFRRRLIAAAPFFLILGIYALWRRYMLGRWLGGYSLTVDWTAPCRMILKIPSFIFGDGPFGMVSFLMIIALMSYAGWRNPSVRTLIVVAILLLLGPILPVIHISDPQRLLLLFVWTLSAAVALTLGTIARSSSRRVITALVIGVVIGFSMAGQGWKTRPGLEVAAAGFAAHGRFIMEADESEALLPSIRFGNWFATGLLWLRKNVLGEQPPIVVFDEIDLAKPNIHALRFFRYDATRGSLVDVTGLVPRIYEEWGGKVRDKPLSVTLNYKGGMLSWVLGPYVDGKYSIITYGDSGYKLGIPCSGIQRVELTKPLLFRVRYDAPEGWTTYSPMFEFDGQALIKKQGHEVSYVKEWI